MTLRYLSINCWWAPLSSNTNPAIAWNPRTLLGCDISISVWLWVALWFCLTRNRGNVARSSTYPLDCVRWPLNVGSSFTSSTLRLAVIGMYCSVSSLFYWIMHLFVSASIHQGHEMFGNESRGRQCAFMALNSILYEQISPVTAWSANRLDAILECSCPCQQRFAADSSLMQRPYRWVIRPPKYAWSLSTGPLWPVPWIVTRTVHPLCHCGSKQIKSNCKQTANWETNLATNVFHKQP